MNEIFNFKERFEGEIDRKKRQLLGLSVTILVAAAIFLLAQAVSTIKEYGYIGIGVPATNTISVSGSGEVFAIPDVANISFSARAEAKTVADAQKQVTAVVNSAIDFVKKSGVEDKDIKTVNYSANPRYEYQSRVCPQGSESGIAVYCPPGRQVLTGYEVTQTISVKVRNTDTVGAILDGLGKQKVTDISGPDFTVDDDTALKAEARKKAIAEAKAKAEVLSKDLGVRLVRVVNFSESGNYPIFYGKEALGMGGGISDSASVPSVPAGQNKITSDVTITYEIR